RCASTSRIDHLSGAGFHPRAASSRPATAEATISGLFSAASRHVLSSCSVMRSSPVLPNAKLFAACDSFPLSADQHIICRQQLRVLCDHQTLNTERTEHLRDLSVEALEAGRPQRTSHWLRPTGALRLTSFDFPR